MPASLSEGTASTALTLPSALMVMCIRIASVSARCTFLLHDCTARSLASTTWSTVSSDTGRTAASSLNGASAGGAAASSLDAAAGAGSLGAGAGSSDSPIRQNIIEAMSIQRRM